MKNEKDVTINDDMKSFLKNAIALEEHLDNCYKDTKKIKFKKMRDLVRAIRSKWLYRFTKEDNSQGYCASKHSLGCSIFLVESANRFSEEKKEKLMEEAINDSAKFDLLYEIINDFDLKGGEK